MIIIIMWLLDRRFLASCIRISLYRIAKNFANRLGLLFGFLEVIIIQVLAKTDYQDVYRVTDGVLLIVNKFEYMFEQRSPVDYSGKRRKMYHKNTKYLAINQEDKIDWYKNFIPKGTVLYHNYPVVATDNQAD